MISFAFFFLSSLRAIATRLFTYFFPFFLRSKKKEKRKLSKQKPNKKGTGNDGLYHHAYGHETKCRPTIVEDLNISSPNYERKNQKTEGKKLRRSCSIRVNVFLVRLFLILKKKKMGGVEERGQPNAQTLVFLSSASSRSKMCLTAWYIFGPIANYVKYKKKIVN